MEDWMWLKLCVLWEFGPDVGQLPNWVLPFAHR
jgi:hypothetical protein